MLERTTAAALQNTETLTPFGVHSRLNFNLTSLLLTRALRLTGIADLLVSACWIWDIRPSVIWTEERGRKSAIVWVLVETLVCIMAFAG